MRRSMMAAVPILAALVAAPASAQLSARVHVGIPIGRPGAGYAVRSHQLLVHDYDQGRYGDWQDYYDDWAPETVYLYDGNYYDYPIVEYAQPIVVYRYRDEFFFAPRQRQFVTWREQYRPLPGRGYIGRGYDRPGYGRPGYGRQYEAPRDGRDGRQYEAPRDARPPQYPRNDQRAGAPESPRGGQRDGQGGGQGGGRVQAPHGDQGGHQGQAPHSAGRSRGRP